MKKLLKISGIILIVLFLFTGIYIGFEIFKARKHTVETILPETRSAKFPLAVSDLSPRQLEILLKVEDPEFFKHGGIDFSTPGAGITTITQGLVKHLYFKKFKPGFAKLKQTLIAGFVLDPLMSKEVQLRLFINTVFLGNGTYGFEQASLFYFHKQFKQLTEEQYIAIVAQIIAPEVFNIKKYPARNKERMERIKKLISGKYTPVGLFDLYYGKIDPEIQSQLPAMSYFPFCYK